MSRRTVVRNVAAFDTSRFGGALIWQEILRDYDEWHAGKEVNQISWFRRQTSLRAAIETAARAVDDRGKRYDHQYRIWRTSILQATAALVAAESAIAASASFDDLLRLITTQLREVAGIGALYCYDAAFRIGAYLGTYPTRVYLHRGTRAGACALGLNYRKDALEMSEVPEELSDRQPYEIENILCIYEKRFKGASTRGEGKGQRRYC